MLEKILYKKSIKFLFKRFVDYLTLIFITQKKFIALLRKGVRGNEKKREYNNSNNNSNKWVVLTDSINHLKFIDLDNINFL